MTQVARDNSYERKRRIGALDQGFSYNSGLY